MVSHNGSRVSSRKLVPSLLSSQPHPPAALADDGAVGRPGCVCLLQHLNAITKLMCVQPAQSVAVFGSSLKDGEDAFNACACINRAI